ncbi:titin-like [Dermacentor albipictus]|uniref:titin-like n=1 Tax=Dermacentor albipictus TaxID=60249 RepID=UPI0038FC7D05
MSGPPSRPTPPSKPHSVIHEGVTISGVRVGSVLQGTRSQDHWLTPGRPCLGGQMSPGGVFALSASTSRSSGSSAAVHKTRGGRSDLAAQDKIDAAGSRSPPSRERSGGKIQAWRSFSAGSCNACSGAHVRASRRVVNDGSEFQFSLASNKSHSGSDRSVPSSTFEPDDVSMPMRQGSTLSVHLRAAKSPAGSVEYACTVSPPISANVLPGAPLRRPVVETRVSARVVTTTVEMMPPVHARAVTPRRSSIPRGASSEVLKTDKREGQGRRSVTFTDGSSAATSPKASVRDAAAIPESKSEQPHDDGGLAAPKKVQPQQSEPRLGPPVADALQTVPEPSTGALLKPSSEPSDLTSVRESVPVAIPEPKSEQPHDDGGLAAPKKVQPQESEPRLGPPVADALQTVPEPSTGALLKPSSEPSDLTSVRESVPVAIPEPKSEQPHDDGGLAAPKKVQPQQSEPRLGPPVADALQTVPEPSTGALLKPSSEPSDLTSVRESVPVAIPEPKSEQPHDDSGLAAPKKVQPQHSEPRLGPPVADALQTVPEPSTGALLKPSSEPSDLTSVRESVAIPEPKSEQPHDDSGLAAPKTVQPQHSEPRLGPPVADAKEPVRESSSELLLKPASELSDSSEGTELPKEPLTEGEGPTAASKHHRELSTGHTPSMALVLQDEPEEDATQRAARPQPPPAEFSVTKEEPNAQAPAGENSAPTPAVRIGQLDSEPEYQPRDLLSEHDQNKTEATDIVVISPVVSTDRLQSGQEERKKLDAHKLLPAHIEEAAPAAETAAQVETKPVVEVTAAEERGEPEAKADIQPPEIVDQLALSPMVSGGLLEEDITIMEHAKPEEAEASEITAATPSPTAKTSDTNTLNEVAEPQGEGKEAEEIQAHSEEAAPAANISPQIETKPPVEVTAAEERGEPETKAYIQQPEFMDKLPLHPIVTGGLLEEDSTTAEHAKPEEAKASTEMPAPAPCSEAEITETKALGEAAEPEAGAKTADEIPAHIEQAAPAAETVAKIEAKPVVEVTAAEERGEPEAKADIQPIEIVDHLALSPMVSGGLLEEGTTITEHTKPEEAKASEITVAEPCPVAEISDTKAIVEVSEPQTEPKAPEEMHVHTEEAAPAAEIAPQVETKPAVEPTPIVERVEPKGDIEPPETADKLPLHPMVTGGLLEEDTPITEHASPEEAKASEITVAEPCPVAEISETKDIVEVSEPQTEPKAPEEMHVHTEEAAPAAEIAPQVETKPAVEPTPIVERAEPKGDIEPPEIADKLPLHPMVTGGLLEEDTPITEHARPEEAKASEITVAEPCPVAEISETKAIVEVSEPQTEPKAPEEMHVHTEEAAPAAEIAPQVETKPAVEPTPIVERVEPKGDIEPPEIADKLPLHPMVTGGLLEEDTPITEHARPEEAKASEITVAEPCPVAEISETKAIVEVSEPQTEPKAPEEMHVHTEEAAPAAEIAPQVETKPAVEPNPIVERAEPKGDIEPPEIADKLPLHPMVTGGLLEEDTPITEHARPEEAKASEITVAEPCPVAEISETKAIVEVSEPQTEPKAPEEMHVHTEEAAPAAEIAPQVETKPAVEPTPIVERVEPKGDIEPPEIADKLPLHPMVTGGLLEEDTPITEHASPEEAKASEITVAEPCPVAEISETKDIVEVSEPQTEPKAPEEMHVHTEEAAPAAEIAPQVETKPAVEPTPIVERAEPKGDIEPPEIADKLPLHPMVTGGLLEEDTPITEHARPEEAKASEITVAEPCPVAEIFETKAIVEVSEPQTEPKAPEEMHVHTEEAAPAAEIAPQVETKPAVEPTPIVERVEPKGDIEPPEIADKLPLHPMVTGGLLEEDTPITEHARPEEAKASEITVAEPCPVAEISETKAIVEVSEPQTEPKAPEEMHVHTEEAAPAAEISPQVETKPAVEPNPIVERAEPKGDIEPPEIADKLPLHPMVTGGLLEEDTPITEHARPEEAKASEITVAEPCPVAEISETKAIVEVSEPQTEPKAPEEMHVHTEEAAPAAEIAPQVETKPAVEPTPIVERVEPKGDIEPPEIADKLPLHPMVTGGLLEEDTPITEHARPEEATASTEMPAPAPCSEAKITETNALGEAAEPEAEAETAEEIPAQIEESAPAAETAAQVETKPVVEVAAAEERGEPEAKADIQPPEIVDQLALSPMVSGGLLEEDITIMEHAKPEEAEASEITVAEPCPVAEISETKAIVEVSEPQTEPKAPEEMHVHTEEAAPAAEIAPQVETKPAVEPTPIVERVEPKGDIEPPEIADKLPLHPMVTGGLLEEDTPITEHARPEEATASTEMPAPAPCSEAEITETKALGEAAEPEAEAKTAEEIPAQIEESAPAAETAAQVETKPVVEVAAAEERGEPEAKADIQPPEIVDQLALSPIVSGGLLEEDITIMEHAKPEGAEASEITAATPRPAAETSDTNTLNEVAEPQGEGKEAEEIQAHSEEAAPAANILPQVEAKPPVEVTAAEERGEPETKAYIQQPEFMDKLPLHPIVTGGLLEEDSTITEHAKPEEAKASTEMPAPAPCSEAEITETKALGEAAEPEAEAKTTEEIPAHIEEAAPAAGTAAQVETKPVVEVTAAEERGEPEAKADIQPPEIVDQLALSPIVSGGLLEEDITIMEHAKPEGAEASEITAATPSPAAETSDTNTLNEVAEPQGEGRETEEIQAHSEEAAPAANILPQVETKPPVEVTAAEERGEPETKSYIQQPEFMDKLPLHPIVTGGLLEEDTTIAEHARPEEGTASTKMPVATPCPKPEISETKATVVVDPQAEAKAAEEIQAHTEEAAPTAETAPQVVTIPPVEVTASEARGEPETKADIQQPEFIDKLPLHQMVTGGLLEEDSTITQRVKPQEAKTSTEMPVASPCPVAEISETKSVIEAMERHAEAKVAEEIQARTEEVAPAAEIAGQVESKLLIEVTVVEEKGEPETKADNQQLEFMDKLPLHPMVTGGLLEEDSTITEHSKPEEAKASKEMPVAAPCPVAEISESKALDEVAEPQGEAKVVEEIQAHTEEAVPAAETVAQVETKPAVQVTAAEERVEPEAKADIQRPEIVDKLPLHPVVTGGLLEEDSTITEHAKPEEGKGSTEMPVAAPCPIAEISETKALVEEAEPQAEAKKAEEIQGHAEEVAPAAEIAAHVETKLAVEAAAAEERGGLEAKADIQPPEMTDELLLHPMVTGGLLEGDSTIAEQVKPEETKATGEGPVAGPYPLADISGETKVLVEVAEPQRESKMTEEIQAHTEAVPVAKSAAQVEIEPLVEATAAKEIGEPEAKGDIQASDFTDELSFHPRVTGGLLEGDSRITEAVKSEETKPTAEEPVASPRPVERTVLEEQAIASKVAEAFGGPSVVLCASGVDVSGVLAEKLAPISLAKDLPSSSTKDVSDGESKIEPGDIRAAELSPARLHKSESLDEIERQAKAVFSTDAAEATHFAFSVKKPSLTDTCSQTQLPASSLKRRLSWTSAQNAGKTPIADEVKTLYIDAGVLFGGPQYDSDQISLDRASTSSQAAADTTEPPKEFPLRAENALELELGFVPTTDDDVDTGQSGRSQPSSTPVGEYLPNRESGVPPPILSEKNHSSEVELSDSTREARPSELEKPFKESEDGDGAPAKGIKATPEETEDLPHRIREQVGNDEQLRSASPCVLDLTGNALVNGTSYSGVNLPEVSPNLIQGKQTGCLLSPLTSEYEKQLVEIVRSEITEKTEPPIRNDHEHTTENALSVEHELPDVVEQQSVKHASAEIAESTTMPVLVELVAMDKASANPNILEYHGEVAERETAYDRKVDKAVTPSSVPEDVMYTDSHVEQDLSGLKPRLSEREVPREVEIELTANTGQPHAANDAVAPSHDVTQCEGKLVERETERTRPYTTEASPLCTEPMPKAGVGMDVSVIAAQVDAVPIIKASVSSNTELVGYHEQQVENRVPNEEEIGADKSDVITTERTNKTAVEAAMVEAMHTDRESEERIEHKNLLEETTALSKAPLAINQDRETEPALSNDLEQRERSSSVSTDHDKTIPPAESDDFLPEGIPDPVSCLGGFFDEQGASQITLQSTQDHGVTSDGLEEKVYIIKGTESSKKEKDVSGATRELETQSAFISNEAAVEGVESLRSAPAVTEEDKPPKNASAISLERAKQEGFEDTGKLRQAEDRITTYVLSSITERKPSSGERDVASPKKEVDEHKPSLSGKYESPEGAEGWQSPPAVIEEDALPGDPSAVSLENGLRDTDEGTRKVGHTEEKRTTKASPSAAKTKSYPEEKNMTLTKAEVGEHKPPLSTKDQSSEEVEDWQSPPGVVEVNALPDDAIAVSSEQGNQQGYEGTGKVMHTGEEKPITGLFSSATEAVPSTVDKDMASPSTEVAEHKPNFSGKDLTSERAEGWQSPPGVKEQALPEYAREASPEQSKQEGYEGTRKIIHTGEEKPVTELFPSATEAFPSMVDKEMASPSAEGAEHKSALSGKNQSSEGAEGWKSPPGVIEEQAFTQDASAVSLEHTKQEGYEGTGKVMHTGEEPITGVLPSTTEAMPSTVDKDITSASTEVAEPKPPFPGKDVTSQGAEGWQSPPEVREEQPLPEDASAASLEHRKQEDYEGTGNVMHNEEEKPITGVLPSATEAMPSTVDKDMASLSTEVAEHTPHLSGKDLTSEGAEGWQSPPGVREEQALPEYARAASPEHSKQEGYEGTRKAIHTGEEKPVTELFPSATEALPSMVDNEMASPSAEEAEHKSALSGKNQSSEGAEGWKSPPGVIEEQAFTQDASSVSLEHTKQKAYEGTGKVMHTGEEKPITGLFSSATEAVPSAVDKDMASLSTEVAEQKPNFSGKDLTSEGAEGWQSPPGVREEQALPEYAREASPEHSKQEGYEGTRKIIHTGEEKPVTELFPSATEAFPSMVDKEMASPSAEGAEHKSALSGKNQSSEGTEGWKSPPGVIEEQVFTQDASAVSLEHTKQEGYEGTGKVMHTGEAPITGVLPSTTEAMPSTVDKDITSASTEVAEPKPPFPGKDVTSQGAEGWQSPPEVREEQPLPEDASAASLEHRKQEDYEGTGNVMHNEEEKPITGVLPSATEAMPSTVDKDMASLSTEVAEHTPHLSGKDLTSEGAEGWQSPPGVREEQALPEYARAASPEHSKQEGYEGTRKAIHTGEEKPVTELFPSATEALPSMVDKEMASPSAEEAEHKSALSGKNQPSEGAEGWKSPPGVTEEQAFTQDASAVSLEHTKQEGYEGTGKVRHTGEEPVTGVLPSTTEAMPSTVDKDMTSASTEVAEPKPHLSVKDQPSEGAEGRQSPTQVIEEQPVPVDARAAASEHSKQEGYEGTEKIMHTGEEKPITEVLPTASEAMPSSVHKDMASTSTEGAEHKPPFPGKDVTSQWAEGWQSPPQVREEQPLPEDASAASLEHRKQEDYEGTGKVIHKEEEKPITGVLPSATEAMPSTVDKDMASLSTEVAEHTPNLSGKDQSSEGAEGRQSLTEVIAEQALQEDASAVSLEHSKQEGYGIPRKVVRTGADKPVAEVSPSTTEAMSSTVEKEMALPRTEVVEHRPPPSCKLTQFLASGISGRDDEDSWPRRPDKDTARKSKQATPPRESAYPLNLTAPTNRREKVESNPTASQPLGTDFSHSATSTRRISPPHHGSEVQSLLCCKICGQSFFRSNPTHAELCSGYHKDAALPAATSGVPPSPQFLEKYVLSVVDEDDVSDVLRQAWRDEETAILASTVWSLYRCVPSSFYVIREREKRPTSRGDVCASACVITFGDEVSVCGFFHVSRERYNTGLSRMLWSRMLDACQGKNMCAVMPQGRAQPFLDRYHFHVSYWGDIVYCHVTLRKGSFPAPSGGSGTGVLVRDLDLKRDAESVIEYDHGVLGFDRSYYLRVALAEEEQTVKVATVASSEGRVVVVGYAGVQVDQRGRPALRWLLADGDEAAQALMHSVVETCPKIREKGLVGVFYAASHAAGVILNSVDIDFMEPWALLYNKREPFLRYDRIVSLTSI